MGRKTDGEKIDELEKVVATLAERLDNTRRELTALRDDLKRGEEDAVRRRWALLPPVISAVLSGIISALVAFFVANR